MIMVYETLDVIMLFEVDYKDDEYVRALKGSTIVYHRSSDLPVFKKTSWRNSSTIHFPPKDCEEAHAVFKVLFDTAKGV